MRLCKRNDRDECDNRKLNNSAYCLSCHKEIEETNNYVSSVYGSMGSMMAQLVEAQDTVLRENQEMMRIVNESMDRIAEMREVRRMQKQYADASPGFRLRPYQEAGLQQAAEAKGRSLTVMNTSNLSVWPHITVYGGS